MLIVRLVHLKDMPSYENILESLKENNSNKLEENNNKPISLRNDKKVFLSEENEITKVSKDQIKNIMQTKPDLTSLSQKNLPKNFQKIGYFLIQEFPISLGI